MDQLPQKDQFRLNEVCEFTDTQPYVLRFWESEFPQLSPARSRSGQPVYSREDIDLVQRIKQLLYDEEYTLADARRKLEEGAGDTARAKRPRTSAAAATPSTAPTEPEVRATPGPRRLPIVDDDPQDTIDKARYETAVEEIEHLRLKLKEAERELRRADEARDHAQGRAERAALRLESLVESLESLEATDPEP